LPGTRTVTSQFDPSPLDTTLRTSPPVFLATRSAALLQSDAWTGAADNKRIPSNGADNMVAIRFMIVF